MSCRCKRGNLTDVPDGTLVAAWELPPLRDELPREHGRVSGRRHENRPAAGRLPDGRVESTGPYRVIAARPRWHRSMLDTPPLRRHHESRQKRTFGSRIK